MKLKLTTFISLFFIASLTILLPSCNIATTPTITPELTPTITPEPTPTITPEPTPTITPEPTPFNLEFPNYLACERPFSEESIWNTPIDWSTAELHPNSRNMVEYFFEGGSNENFLATNLNIYKVPIYVVSSNQALVPVKLDNSYRDAVQENDDGTVTERDDVLLYNRGGTVWLPVPDNAAIAVGTDAQILIVEWDTGYIYGLRAARYNNDGDLLAGTAYEYHISFDGVPNDPNFQFRGATSDLLAGYITSCEYELFKSGSINAAVRHAGYVAYDFPCSKSTARDLGYPEFISPWVDTDGISGNEDCIPEGARIAINPTISYDEIQQRCNGYGLCELIALVGQQYGFFILDRADRASVGVESTQTATNFEQGKDWTRDMMRPFSNDFIVLDWNTDR